MLGGKGDHLDVLAVLFVPWDYIVLGVVVL